MTTRWLVISPHLDDAVFGCGRLLAQAPGSIVATVFAGIPPRAMPTPPWDRDAGFASAHEAMQARRVEDRHALSILRAEPHWLDFLDDQYGCTVSDDALLDALRSLLDTHAQMGVLAPAGLFHRDHLRVQHAMLALLGEQSATRRWFFYEDALYRRKEGLMEQRLAHWKAQGWTAQPAALVDEDTTDGSALAKAKAVRAYRSQVALFRPDTLLDLERAECYWQLQRVPTAS
ncbi:PIG-L deacetylase family protein [Mycetohabitans endofungorum]|uniref:PIG-L deacetylase family protein n=1 Tax=Mycetohabitans endofungorum TaxID=417203 RepID=UPI002B0550C5|nr:PIG-L family deacetylase [Mycetohabitans endofungorum]